jgi:hypothetical protein
MVSACVLNTILKLICPCPQLFFRFWLSVIDSLSLWREPTPVVCCGVIDLSRVQFYAQLVRGLLRAFAFQAAVRQVLPGVMVPLIESSVVVVETPVCWL